MTEAEDLYYRVTWSADDNEYVGTCDQFPSLSWLDPDMVKAREGIGELVADAMADMKSGDAAERRALRDRMLKRWAEDND